MRTGVWGPFFLFSFFLNLPEAAASAASMQFTALPVCKVMIVRWDEVTEWLPRQQ